MAYCADVDCGLQFLNLLHVENEVILVDIVAITWLRRVRSSTQGLLVGVLSLSRGAGVLRPLQSLE